MAQSKGLTLESHRSLTTASGGFSCPQVSALVLSHQGPSLHVITPGSAVPEVTVPLSSPLPFVQGNVALGAGELGRQHSAQRPE